MDVGHLRKARGGSVFLAYGTGDVRIKILGDQDEEVDIDDGDTDTAPYIDASLAGGALLNLSSVQTVSKRKALETEPSTSTPTKRAKFHGNSCDFNDIVRKSNKPEEVQPRDTTLRTRNEDLPLKRKEIIKDEDGEGSDKCPGVIEMVREKRPRMLVLGDESDEDMFERDEAPASPKSDGEGKKVSGVEVAAEMSLKNDSHAVGFAMTGLAGSGKKVVGKQRLLLAGENNLVPLRSAFPLHAKRNVHPPVPSDSKSNTGAGFAAHIADENSPCERNTRNPKYASRSAPQELNDHCKGEIHDSKLKLRSERDAGKEVEEILDQKSELAKEKAQRNMVWVKVGGKDFWWPGLIVTAVPAAIQKKMDEIEDTPKAVRLFHPRKDVEEYQVVKRSSLKPFHLCLSYKDSSSHPDFIVAVIEAEQYVSQPDSQMEGFSQLGTSSREGPKRSGLDGYGRCHADVPYEHVESIALTSVIPDREQLQESTYPMNFQQAFPSLSSGVLSDSTLPVTSPQVDTALPSDIPEREQLQQNTVSSPSHQLEVARSAHRSLRNDHATNQNAGSERNRSYSPGMLAPEMFPDYLFNICSMLDLPGPATERADEIFKYFQSRQKQVRRSRPHHEIFAIQLCVVWMAAEQFDHAIDKAMSICLVEERLCVSYRNRGQFEGELYKKVKDICSGFTPRPAPLVNVPTTSLMNQV